VTVQMQAPVQVPIPCASECLQAADGFLQDVDALAEREADEGCALVLVVVEDGVGGGDDTGAFGEGAAEGEAVGFAEGADVGGDEVRAGGRKTWKPASARPPARTSRWVRRVSRSPV
jgi:hypothetical protein